MSRDQLPLPDQQIMKTMKKFVDCLQLETLGDDLFRAHTPDFGWRRVFGGQFIAQAVRAAQATMRQDRYIHSLHCYFIRPGDPATETIYKVDRVRDGASFSLRSITAKQHGHVVFTMQASFHKREQGLEHQVSMPDVSDPSEVNLKEALDLNKTDIIKPLKDYLERERPFEFRPLSIDRFVKEEMLEPSQAVWLRLLHLIPEARDPHMGAAMLSYVSDALLIDTALFPHATNIFDGRIQGASLDHAIWFHKPIYIDDWILYQMESPIAAGSRGMAQGRLFSKDGRLLATVAQEGLIRKRANA